MATNWDEMGITWSVEPVKRQHGGHATDRAVLGDAQIPVLTDLDAFRYNVPEADKILLGVWDGTSVRVQAQDVSRRMLERGHGPDEIRAAVWNRVLGVRSAVRAPRTYPLPGGKRYEGNNLLEYREAFKAAAVAMALSMGATHELAERIGTAQSETVTF